MAYSATTVEAMIDQIKLEARIEGSDNLDDLILALVNEEFLQETENHRYAEMLVVNYDLTLVDEQENYTLPDNFADVRLVRYKFANGYSITLNPRTEYVKERVNGLPKFYDIAGGEILIFPYAQVLADDELLLDYYKHPDQLANDDTAFPIQRLVSPIKRHVIARLLVYNKDMPAAQFHTGMASASTRQVQLEDQ